MAQEFFANVADAIRVTFRHLTNADPTTLILAVAVIALVGYFLLRTR